jgi:RecB family exonuclease
VPINVFEKENTIEEIKTYVKQNYESLKVSVTLLNNFFDCPWKWYFRNFLKLPEIKGVSLALGSAVHSCIEFILKSESVPTQKDIEEKITLELRKEGITNAKELNRLHKDALSAVDNWLQMHYPHLIKERISERSVSFRDPNFPSLMMYGKIDLTEKLENGDVIITDFKTGSVKTKSMIEKETEDGKLSDYMRQLAMYSYLVFGAEKKVVKISKLLFVEADKGDKNALYETYISNQQVDLLIKDIKEYDEQLKSGEWASRECQHKGYGQKTKCEYCDLAKMFKS